MNEIFKHKKIIILGGVIIFAVLFIWCLLSRENVHDNRESIDSIRNELERAEDAKQDITSTAEKIDSTSSGLAETIRDATNTSAGFDKVLEQCQTILDQIRKQPNEN